VKDTVLFDLGGTLVEYHGRRDVPHILAQAIDQVEAELRRLGRLRVSSQVIRARVAEENHEADDHRVRPLAGRLMRIFDLDPGDWDEALVELLCRAFLRPIFARGRRFDDAIPALRRFRSSGWRIGIVSNTAWGSPGRLWREELARHSLDEWIDLAVFCTDVGWRKPAPRVYEWALERLGSQPEATIFVGDDARWDYDGPRRVGIEAVLLDRRGTTDGDTRETVRDLHEFCERALGRAREEA
jgi:FMN phosphatase YigB (HAD superfamily)